MWDILAVMKTSWWPVDFVFGWVVSNTVHSSFQFSILMEHLTLDINKQAIKSRLCFVFKPMSNIMRQVHV